MSVIPIYAQRISASGELGPGPTGSRGVQVHGAGLESVAEDQAKMQEGDAASWAILRLSKAQSDLTQ